MNVQNDPTFLVHFFFHYFPYLNGWIFWLHHNDCYILEVKPRYHCCMLMSIITPPKKYGGVILD